MDSVGNALHRHVFFGKNAFYGSGFLEFTVFIDYGHCVVKMGGMGHAGFVGSLYLGIFCAGMCDGWQNSMFTAAADEID